MAHLPLEGTDMAFATIIAKNYLSHARVLARSLEEIHPEIPFFVLLTDEIHGTFDPREEPFDFISLSTVGFPVSPANYGRQQLAVMLKPYVLGFLLDQGFDSAVFLDPDILVLNRLDSLLDQVRQHPLTLTPHLLQPPRGDKAVEIELNFLLTGTLNGGFIGVSNCATAFDFLSWWRERMHAHCRHDLAQGVYYDQRWLDLAPTLFEGVCIVRDPEFNIAYWNLAERNVRLDGEQVPAAGKPCGFFHFSGFEPENLPLVTRYNQSLTLDDIGSAAVLFQRYASLLKEEGYETTNAW